MKLEWIFNPLLDDKILDGSKLKQKVHLKRKMSAQ